MTATEPISLLMISSHDAEIEWVSQLCERAASDIAFFSAGDVASAAAVIAANKINVALLDLGQSKGVDDPKTMQMIDDLGRSAPVIVITDSADINIEQFFIDNGVVDVLHRQELTPSGLRRSLRYAIARRDADRHLARLQLLDPVTGLAAQPLFWEILALAVRRAKRNRDFFAVMLVDFKSAGTNGMEAPSNELMIELTSRLQQIMRASDTIARFDSRQFAILAESMPRIEDVQIVAAKIISELSKTEASAGALQVAVGIALFPTSAASAEGLISRASEAVQQVIARDKNDFAFA
ncbi:MAG TPA: GGDEF domain-containing protein [Dongiaceae bacterium]|nr:GGDEF domain-containing protein [Dongiaceae bacterium]